jgi:hypothetical protein
MFSPDFLHVVISCTSRPGAVPSLWQRIGWMDWIGLESIGLIGLVGCLGLTPCDDPIRS